MDASRVWPSPDAYQNAVLSPRRYLRDARLHAAHVESRFFLGSQRPNLRSGNFGAVYRFKGAQRSYALKVFYKADTERQQRYQLIDQHLAGQAQSTHLVSCRYDEEGIQVHRRWYPTLLMDWAPGKTLDLYLQECRGEIRNGLFCQSFAHMVNELQERRMAHGDLQHGNILVQAGGQLKLVDYDGMFVPAMSRLGMEAAESGLPAYQHPSRARRPDYFDARLDDFAALVILLTLAAMTPERWGRHHGDDNYLLVSKQTLHLPKRAALFQELAAAPEAPIRRLANLLKIATVGPIESIPPFSQVVADPAIREIFNSSWRPGLPTTRVQAKVLRGGPWWQNQPVRRAITAPPPRAKAPSRAEVPVRAEGLAQTEVPARAEAPPRAEVSARAEASVRAEVPARAEAPPPAEASARAVAPARAEVPARPTPFPAILQLRRPSAKRTSPPSARAAPPPAQTTAPPAKKPVSQARRVPVLRLLQPSPAPEPKPPKARHWGRLLYFVLVLALVGFFVVALNWRQLPFERFKPVDAVPVRNEGRQP